MTRRKRTATAPSRLKGFREQRCLGAAELAKQAGVTRQTIYAIEDGSFVPNTVVALRLARALDVSVEDIFSLPEDSRGSVKAELLAGPPGPPSNQLLVRLYRTASKNVALPAQSFFNYLPPADGFVGKQSGRKIEIETSPDRGAERGSRSEQILVAGCDPALSVLSDFARLEGIEVVAIPASSRDALAMLARGEVHVAGMHLLHTATGEYNTPAIRKQFPRGGVQALTFAEWETGLVTRPGNPKRIHAISDLSSPRIALINREKGSGARAQLDSALKQAGIPASRVNGYERVVLGHLPAAYGVANAFADCCIATRSAARCFGLSFVPLRQERFDLVCPNEFLAARAGQAIAGLLNRSVLTRRLAGLAGYETGQTGKPVF